MCACLLSIVFILVGLFAPDRLLRLMGADDTITALGTCYTRTFLMFTPFFMCNYIVSAYVRNDNDPSRAMIATLCGSLFNIVFDYIFMFPMKLWNYGKSPEYNVRRGTKFPSGKVEIFANVIESKIQDIKIYGDFFGIEDVAAVEDVLRGVKYEREDVLKALQTINLGRYFAGITAEEIAEAVVE